jgi:hypothetical protein
MRVTRANIFPRIPVTSRLWTSNVNKNAFDSDKYKLTRKSLPTWLVRQSNGLLYAYGTRLYVPDVSTLRSKVLYELHNAPTAGHHGIIRLLTTLTRTFWWPNMSRTIQHYVRSCATCQPNKTARHKPYGLLQSHEVPTRPFGHVSLEQITDLHECDGCDVVVVVVCMLTKRTIVEPITKPITAEQLAKVVHRAQFRHFGLPRKLISDLDPRFMSDLLWQSVFRAVGTKLNISTSYHPHEDGQT